ncbi:hypothetical protein, partial [Brucella sp.]|uniref:hypothetical protein n=1 Tax=Brucella sp. TaxID=52132 RepID=UPI0028A00030
MRHKTQVNGPSRRSLLWGSVSLLAVFFSSAPVWADDLIVDPAYGNSPFTAVDGSYDTITIGENGAGLYQLDNGSTVTIHATSDFILGKNAGSSGTINLDQGSTLRVEMDQPPESAEKRKISAGQGTGTINVQNGSSLILSQDTASDAYLGIYLGALDSGRTIVNVSGAGSSLETDFRMRLETTAPFGGLVLRNADLTVSDGAYLNSVYDKDGRNGGLRVEGSSTATITGSNTTADLGILSIYEGATVEIADGAHVQTYGASANNQKTSLFEIQGGSLHISGADTVLRWAGDSAAFPSYSVIQGSTDGTHTPGMVLVDNGATVIDNILDMSVRIAGEASAVLTVDGQGSSYNAHYLTMGATSSDPLRIINVTGGGAFLVDGNTTAPQVMVGSGAGNVTLSGNSTIRVDGAGSVFAVKNTNWNPSGVKPGSIVIEPYRGASITSNNNVLTVANGGMITASEIVTQSVGFKAGNGTINIGAAAGEAATGAGILDVSAVNTTLTYDSATNTYTDGGPGSHIDLVFNHTESDYRFDPLILNQTHVNVIAGRTVLTGNNSYTAGSEIGKAGTLVISSDANLGDVSGGLAFAGGTLAVTDTIVSARALSLATDGGTVSVA